VGDLADEARHAPDRDRDRIDERLEALEGQARHVGFLVGCRDPRDLGDAFVTLTRVPRHGPGLDSVHKLARMYLNLAGRYALEVEVLDDRQETDPAEDVIVLLVSGAGAHALLAGEAGLHQLVRGKGKTRDRKGHTERDVVRVEVLPMPAGDDPARELVQVETRPLAAVEGRLLARPRLEVLLRHEPSLLTVRAWTDRNRAEAVEGLRPLLRARVAAAEVGAADGRPPVVRRYALGPAPLVRDARSGRSTGRLEQVLAGDLDLFLAPGE
jgi:protein subunit release factor A